MTERLDRIRGSLLAGAIGDALGAPVEFWSWAQIEQSCGPAGVTGYLPAYGRDGGAITDDTQMTLFTAEGALRRDGSPIESLWRAYRRWLHTQDLSVDVELDGDLVHLPQLRHQRAPGNTCLSALRGGRPGTRSQPVNNSKGCGGVMRVAPLGLLESVDDPFATAADAAALTHGHPSGYLPAGVLAHAIRRVMRGATLPEAIDDAIARLQLEPQHEETLDALAAARRTAVGAITPGVLEALGGGWTGEEALAIAVACALAAGDDVAAGLLWAVNHSGDTDSTGAICGNLLGAQSGADAIPSAWIDSLEDRDIIERVARDVYDASV